ncbi:MAG: hypothetical protein QXN40_05890 [Candidatus Bathyarchaeia archaeon]
MFRRGNDTLNRPNKTNSRIKGAPLKPFAVLKKEAPIRWQPCPLCGGIGLEFYVKFADGEERFICGKCGRS